VTRLLRRIFNLPAYPDQPSLIDNKGRYFWIAFEGKRPFEICLFHRGRMAAIARMRWEDNYLDLGDFYINDRKFRRTGLGSRFFGLIKKLAIQNGLSMIIGIIAPIDIEDFDRDDLIRFYKKQGCEITGNQFVLRLP
jgi:hypothetical protein